MPNVVSSANSPEDNSVVGPKASNKASFISKLKRPKVYIPLAILFCLYIGINVFVYFYSSNVFNLETFARFPFLNTFMQPTESPTPTPTPRPIRAIPGGKQVYTVSNGSDVAGPKIQEVTIDPQTPKSSETQTVTITVKNDSPVTEATAIIQTDHNQYKNSLKLISGTATNGIWQGSWSITDTYNYTYAILFDLKSSTGEYNNGMRFRE